jgi:hypothetical protein
LELLELIANDFDYHVLTLTEHGCANDEIHVMNLKNYNLASSYCRNNYKSGGVSIFCRININYKKLTWIDRLSIELDFEVTGILLKLNRNNKIILITIYRSPSGNINKFLTSLDLLLEKVTKDFENIIITGDLNINWLSNDTSVLLLKDIFLAYNLKNVVDRPTRVTGTSASQIDYIVTNIHSHLHTGAVVNNNVSDHLGQQIYISEFTCENINASFKNRRILSNNNLSKFCSMLESIEWDVVLQGSHIDDKWSRFYETVLNIFNCTCPVNKIRIKIDNKIFKTNFTCKKLKHDMLEMFRIYKQTRMEIFKTKYKNLKENYLAELKKCKADHLNDRLMNSTNIQKDIWSIANELTHFKNKSVKSDNIELIHDKEEIKDPNLICNIFNEHFLKSEEVVKTNCSDLVLDSGQQNLNKIKITNIISFSPVTESEIESIICNLKAKKSSGWDELSMYIIKKCKNNFTSPLTKLINESFEAGIFPECLKLAIVRPIFKKGSKKDVNNFRPISLLPSFSKIIEKAIYCRIVHFLDANKVLIKSQYGFRKGRSTVGAIIDFIQTILVHQDKHKKASGTFLDLSKAFDCVNHKILFNKLDSVGIKGRALNLITTYVSNRTQYTEISFEQGKTYFKSKSKLGFPTKGVPQGSILGPLLFILYVNDIPSLKDCHILSYADDTSFISLGKDVTEVEEIMKYNFNKMQNYFLENNLQINYTKTNYIIFGNSSPCSFYKLNDKVIEEVTSAKFLGVLIDKDLRWDLHIDMICSKINKNSFLLQRLRSYYSTEYLLQIYYGVIFPHLNYGIEVWGGAAEKYINRLLCSQKRVLRLIFGLKRLESCRDTFKENHILTVYSLYVFKIIIIAKQNHSKHPIPDHPNRNNNMYRIRVNKKGTEKDPFINGVIFYNKLPNFLKALDGKEFVKTLKSYLIKKCLYSLNEF